VTTFSEDELASLEREHARGLSSEEIVAVFARKGVRFTEASLRKYVQLGLLPRSRRVAVKGKKRGSLGLYPASIVRRVQRLKELLTDYTIEQIQREFLFVRSDVEELQVMLERIFLSLARAATSSGGASSDFQGSPARGRRATAARPGPAKATDGAARVVMRELAEARALAGDLVAKITSVESRLSMKARLEREAV